MCFVLSRATSEDSHDLADLTLHHLQSQPLLQLTFPWLHRLDALSFMTTRFQYSLVHDPSSEVWLARNKKSHALVGYAQWVLPTSTPPQTGQESTVQGTSEQGPPSTPYNWEIGEDNINRRLQESLHAALESKRAVYADPQRTYCLDILQVGEAHNGRGIGSSLLAWGLQRADHEGKGVYTETSPDVLGWYQRFGFAVVDEVSVDLQEFGVMDGGQDRWICMLRPAKSSGGELEVSYPETS